MAQSGIGCQGFSDQVSTGRLTCAEIALHPMSQMSFSDFEYAGKRK